jgi:hypothetical protein
MKGQRTMRRTTLLAIMALCMALLFLAIGCSKITNENYAKIETGMSYDEVVAILGPPDEVDDVLGTKSAVWGKDPKTISIKFIADKVVFRSAKGLD